jgi:hypothetical protein
MKTTIIHQKHPVVEQVVLSNDYKKIILVDSPLGTGKTKLAKTIADNNPKARIAYISPFISLAETAAEIFNFHSYLNKGRADSYRIALCSNSLMQIKADDYDLLIIDEPDQVIEMLLGPTIKDCDREEILNHLIALIKNTNVSLILQHKITDSIYELIERANRSNDIHLYKNTYKPWTGINFNQVKGNLNTFFGYLAQEAVTLKNNKEKFIVACSSKKKTKELAIMLRELKLHTLEIHADNAANKAQMDFFKNPTQISVHYDCIVFSPKISSGVSIENPEYTKTFGVLINSEYAITPSTFVQMIARNRCMKSLTLWTNSMVWDGVISEEKAIRSVISLNQIQLKVTGDKVTFAPYKLSWIDKKRIRMETTRNAEKSNSEKNVKTLIKDLSNKDLTEIKGSAKNTKEGKEASKLAAEVRLDKEASEVFKAEDIRKSEYICLSKKNNITTEERAKIKRFRIQEDLASPVKDKSPEEVKDMYFMHEEKRVHKTAEIWEIANLGKRMIKFQLKNSLKSGKYPAAFMGVLFVKRMVLNALIEHIGGKYHDGVITFDKDKFFSVNEFINSKMGTFISNNIDVVNLCGLGGRINSTLNGKVVSLWIRRLGVKTTSKVVRNKNKLDRMYKISSICPDVIKIAKDRFEAGKAFQQNARKNILLLISSKDSSVIEDILEVASRMGVEVTSKTRIFANKMINFLSPEKILDIVTT